MVVANAMRSVRWRLVLFSSVVVFGTSAVAVAAVYLFVSRELAEQTVTKYRVTGEVIRVGDQVFVLPRSVTAEQVQTVEAAFREIVLEKATGALLVTLGVLFVASVVVGWFHAGRVLRPLGTMATVAADIEAHDLGRRLPVDDPHNELGRMAVTFNAMLDRLERAFDQQRSFLAQTSHDLRTPLAVIRSNLEVVMADPDAGVDEWREAAGTAIRAGERMAGMVDSLLAAARFEAGHQPLEDVDLADLLAELASEAAARVEVETRVETGPVIVGDRAALLRAVGNLVENVIGIDAGPLTLAGGVDGDWAYVAVADRGPGFDRDLLRAGPGLGLAIARRIAEAHQGRIDMIPRVGGGSVVAIFLPRAGRTPQLDPVILRLADI